MKLLLLALILFASDVQAQTVRATQFVFGQLSIATSVRVLRGAGSPEAVVTAPIGAVWLQTNSAATVTAVWSKQSGAGNTGWARIAATTDTLAQFAATTSAQFAGVISNETGTDLVVLNNTPTLITPLLGTPTSGVATNLTGLPLTTGVTGVLPVANGGTGVVTLGDAGVLIGNVTGVVQVTGAGTSGQVLTSNGAGVDPTFQAAAGGGAPTDATYITQTANATLSAEQALSTLSSGIMRVATTTGVITSLTDSAGIAANISNETGTDALVFNNTPTLITPVLGVATGTSIALSGNATFGSATLNAFHPLYLTGSINAGGGPFLSSALRLDASVTVAVGYQGALAQIVGTLVEAGSGNHGFLNGLHVNIPVITAGAATVTDATTVYVAGAPTATVSGKNRAFWVDDGRSDLDGTVFMTGLSAGVAGDTDLCLKATTKELTDAAASTCIVSSLRFKSNWQPLNVGLAEVLKLTPGSFYYTNDAKKIERIGLNAENMHAVEPRLAFYEQSGPDIGKPRGVAYEETVALLVKAIQELNLKVEKQLDLIAGLEARLKMREPDLSGCTPVGDFLYCPALFGGQTIPVSSGGVH